MAQPSPHITFKIPRFPLRPKRDSPRADHTSPQIVYLTKPKEPFTELIEAYRACRLSAETVKESVKEPASTIKEAEAWQAIIDRRLQRVIERVEDDQKWCRENELAVFEAVSEDCKQSMEKQIRRLRMLSLDAIDPIAKEPSLVDKAFSSRSAETNGQRVARVLRDAYHVVATAHEEMRKSQAQAYYAKAPQQPGPIQASRGRS